MGDRAEERRKKNNAYSRDWYARLSQEKKRARWKKIYKRQKFKKAAEADQIVSPRTRMRRKNKEPIPEEEINQRILKILEAAQMEIESTESAQAVSSIIILEQPSREEIAKILSLGDMVLVKDTKDRDITLFDDGLYVVSTFRCRVEGSYKKFNTMALAGTKKWVIMLQGEIFISFIDVIARIMDLGKNAKGNYPEIFWTPVIR